MKSIRREARSVLVAGVLVPLAIALSGCSSQQTEEAASTAPAETTVATTTGPAPLTAEETAWVRHLAKVEKHLEKTAFLGGVVTRSRMLAQAKVFAACRKRLEAPSSRFESPFAMATSACRKFRNAAVQLRVAAANVDASGAVIAGTAEEQNFNKAFERANAYAGNAVNRFSAAVARAKTIRDSLPS
jgi:uncharacterized protein YceK